MKFGDIVQFDGSEYPIVVGMYILTEEDGKATHIWEMGTEYDSSMYGEPRRTGLRLAPCVDACRHLPSGVRATAENATGPYTAPLTKVR